MPLAPPPRGLCHRVDALTLAFRVDLAEGTELRQLLDQRRQLAAELGRVAVERGTFAAELQRTRAADRWYLSNADVRVMLDAKGAGAADGKPGWTCEIIPRAVTLARAGLDGAIDLARSIAAALAGGAEHVHGERVRRVDLAADFERWRMRAEDAMAFVKPSRAKVATYHPEETEAEDRAWRRQVRTYSNRRQVTGFTVAAGAPVMARIYDKTAELEANPDEQKRAVEHAAWRAGGWRGGPVTRVEFQLRGVALDELARDVGGLRDPAVLRSRIDSVWRYCHTRWLRLVVPGTATRLSRCVVDARWRAVQSLEFFRPAPVAARIRQRGGATVGTAIGVVLSLLAARDALQPIRATDTETGEVLPPELAIDAMSDEQLTNAIGLAAAALGDGFRRQLAEHLGQQPRRQFRKYLHAVEASLARFSTSLPDSLPPSR